NAAAQVQKIFPPQCIVRERFGFLDLVEVGRHLFRSHGRNSSGRYGGRVSEARHLKRVVGIGSGIARRGYQTLIIWKGGRISVVVVPDVDVIADDEKIFRKIRGSEKLHELSYGQRRDFTVVKLII